MKSSLAATVRPIWLACGHANPGTGRCYLCGTAVIVSVPRETVTALSRRKLTQVSDVNADSLSVVEFETAALGRCWP